MHVTAGHAFYEGVEPLLVTDKRGQHLKPVQREGEGLPIGELGSKAIYQVSATRFNVVIPYN